MVLVLLRPFSIRSRDNLTWILIPNTCINLIGNLANYPSSSCFIYLAKLFTKYVSTTFTFTNYSLSGSWQNLIHSFITDLTRWHTSFFRAIPFINTKKTQRDLNWGGPLVGPPLNPLLFKLYFSIQIFNPSNKISFEVDTNGPTSETTLFNKF